MKNTKKKLQFLKMEELRNKSDEELRELTVSRNYATNEEANQMWRPDLLARIMRLQLNAGLNY